MTGLADQLAQRGRQVQVFADRLRTPGSAELHRPYPIHRFGYWRPIRRSMKLAAIAAAAQESPVTGVFADSWKSLAAIPEGLKPIAVLAHGSEFPANPSAEKARRINEALRRCQTIVASSQFTAQLLEPFLAGVAAHIEVINPPTPPLPEAQSASLRDIDALIGGRAPVITTIARLEPRKGVDSILRALPAVLKRHPRLVYCIAGAGADRARLTALASQLQLDAAVVFLGEVTDSQVKAALLTRSDVYAMPSRRVGNSVEGFGIAYVEAGWYGVASLAGAHGGAGDVVIDGVTGAICRGDDDADVAQGLFRLLDDPERRKAYGAAAAKLARSQFTWEAAFPRYAGALERPPK